MIIHQAYENKTDLPIETMFMMPYSDTFTLSQIKVDLNLPGGKLKRLVTQVTKREEAKESYSNAVAEVKIALISYTESSSKCKAMLRIKLGNFPANSTAYLKAICA